MTKNTTQPKQRADGRIVEVEHHELGRLEGYGPWTCWTLRTQDALRDVLGPDYFSNRIDMKTGDLIEVLCRPIAGRPTAARLIVSFAGPSKTARGPHGPKRLVEVEMLHRYGPGAKTGSPVRKRRT